MTAETTCTHCRPTAFVLLCCLAGAFVAWKPADLFYTEERARHIGSGYLVKIANLDLPDADLQAMTRQTFFERRLFVGIVTAMWGAAVCGLLGACGGWRRSPTAAVIGLFAGALVGAVFGVVAGFSGQYVAETYPSHRYDSDLLQLTKTMGYHSSIYAVLGLGVGIVYGVFGGGRLRFAAAVALSAVAAAGASLAFTPLVSVLIPLADTTSVIPPGSWARLLWFAVPALFVGGALTLAERSPKPAAASASTPVVE